MDSKYQTLRCVCDGIEKLTYTELKVLVKEIETQIGCWDGDLSNLKDILVDAAGELKLDIKND